MIKNYKELQVWQKSVELVKDIYLETKNFPKSELFGLTNQMRRSSVSIPSNIAEGWMRQHTKEYIQFIYHALGSCGELDTQLAISIELGYMNVEISVKIFDEVNHVTRMLCKLARALKEAE